MSIVRDTLVAVRKTDTVLAKDGLWFPNQGDGVIYDPQTISDGKLIMQYRPEYDQATDLMAAFRINTGTSDFNSYLAGMIGNGPNNVQIAIQTISFGLRSSLIVTTPRLRSTIPVNNLATVTVEFFGKKITVTHDDGVQQESISISDDTYSEGSTGVRSITGTNPGSAYLHKLQAFEEIIA